MENVSRIGVKRDNGMIDVVICQKNSEIENVGKLLVEYYNTPELASNLIKHGDISELRPYIDKGIFNKDEGRDETTVYCARDEGRSFSMCKPSLKRTTNSFLQSAREIGASCSYLYAAGQWLYVDMETGEFGSLEEKLASLGKKNNR